jgi:hypothetical protein
MSRNDDLRAMRERSPCVFSQGMIYAPDRDWTEMVISEVSMFPAGRYNDLTDSASQGHAEPSCSPSVRLPPCDAVATSGEDHRSPRSGPAVRHRLLIQGLC